jgi:hypothetical protein
MCVRMAPWNHSLCHIAVAERGIPVSDNPTPEMPTPTPAAAVETAPTTPKKSPLHPTGTTITIVGLIAGLVPVLVLAFGSAIKLETLDAVQSVATFGTILVLASGVLALVATIVNLLRPNSTGKLVSTIVSLVTLVGMAVFLFTTVLPRVNNLEYLNNTIAPFGHSIQNNCQTPLNNETARYNQVVKDSPALPATDSATQIISALGGFASAMTTDAQQFQTDATNLQGDLTNLQNLKVPESKYEDLLQYTNPDGSQSGCIPDVKGTIALLNDTNNGQVPTAPFIQGIQQGVAELPTSEVPASAKPIIVATIKNSLPATYTAITVLQAAAAYAGCGGNPLSPCTAVQLKWPPKVPTSAQQQLATDIYVIVGAGFTAYVNQTFTMIAAQTDNHLKMAGQQLQDDIKATLINNLAPINVDVNAIVGN